ncbi:hypothetical protein D3C72_1137620 [compost metagenome]
MPVVATTISPFFLSFPSASAGLSSITAVFVVVHAVSMRISPSAIAMEALFIIVTFLLLYFM